MNTRKGILFFFTLMVLCISFAFNPELNSNRNISYLKTDFEINAGKLQTGDVILRDSKGMLGSFFRNMSRCDKKFSHAGFIVVGNKTWVCHYIDSSIGNGLVVEELKDFVNPLQCNAFGIYRFPLSAKEKNNLCGIISFSIHHPKPFDEYFDLNTDDRLYCTEWIRNSLWKAAHLKIPVTRAAGMEFIAPDNLYINSGCKMISSICFKKAVKIN